MKFEKLLILLFVCAFSFAVNARDIKVKMVIAADIGGQNQAQYDPQVLKTQIEYANRVFLNSGVNLIFNPNTDVVYVNNPYVNYDFQFAKGEVVGPYPKEYRHRLILEPFIDAKNKLFYDYPNHLLIIVNKGNQIWWNKKSSQWEYTENRKYSYSNNIDRFVVLHEGAAQSQRIVAHELGHFFALPHTHGTEYEKEKEVWDALIDPLINRNGDITRPLMYLDADSSYVWDTPADPGPTFWELKTGDRCGNVDEVTLESKDFYGKGPLKFTFKPDRLNIMSYFFDCTLLGESRISNQQKNRMFSTVEYGLRQSLWMKSTEDTILLPRFNQEVAVASWNPDRMDMLIQNHTGGINHMYFNQAGGFGIDTKELEKTIDIQWGELKGNMQGAPTIISRQDGIIDLFAVAQDGQVAWKYWNNNGGWSPNQHSWYMLGKKGFMGKPAAVVLSPSKMAVLSRATNGHIYIRYYDSFKNGWQNPAGSDNGWIDLGGKALSDPKAVSWAPNRLDVIMKSTNNEVHHLWIENGVFPSDWGNIGGQIKGMPDMVSWGVNRLDMVVRGMDDRIYHKAWTDTGWHPSLTGWNPISIERVSASPKIAHYKKEGLAITGNQSGKVLVKFWNGRKWLPSADQFYSFGQKNIEPNVPISIVSRRENFVNIFARGISSQVFHAEMKYEQLPPNLDLDIIGRNF